MILSSILVESPKEIDAQSSDNFVNMNDTDSGVQLELTTALRQEFLNIRN